MNTAKQTKASKPSGRPEKKDQPKVGLETPIKVIFKEDPVLGDYLNVAIHYNKEPFPVAEFVVSRHIGKSSDLKLQDSWVLNRRKDVPDLIRGARDPSKSRIVNQQKEAEIDHLVKVGLLEKVGETFVLTKKCSPKLSGNEYDHYLDRANAAFQAAKKAALEKHQDEQSKKQTRFKRKFIFDKITSDFYTDDERLARGNIQTEILKPEVQTIIKRFEETGYETLINGEYPQKPLYLGDAIIEELKLTDLAHTLEKYVFGVLTPPKPGKPKPADLSLLEKVVKERDEFLKELTKAREALASLHKYYEATTLLSEKNERIQLLEVENKELSDQLEDLEEEMGEPWKDRFQYVKSQVKDMDEGEDAVEKIKELIEETETKEFHV